METTTAHPATKLYRRADGRVVAGVAGGIAEHLRLPAVAVRVAFVVLLAFSGLGAILYVVFWTVLPLTPRTAAQPVKAKKDTTQMVAFGALALGVLLVDGLIGSAGVRSLIGWLVALVALGAGIIWHQAEPERWRKWNGGGDPDLPWLAGFLTTNDRRSLFFRLAGGGVLVIGGIIGVIAITKPLPGASAASLISGLLFALIALAGLALALGPMLWRMFVQLRDEREGRIRETERAEFAAIVHDQVLHTLALVQRHAEDPKMVLRLARGQERTLRNWLYKPSGSPDERFAAALEAAAAEVEDSFTLSVDLVVVGDCAVDEHVRALVHAAREAMVNAGKHAGVETISVYAEAEPDELSVFVRDRGVGFDPDKVNGDRHGVRGSIIARMERHGGRAEIRSTPGDGTEVRLILGRKDKGE
ncbi:ATP-binding protein [Longispora albida]|uniref:ATP-binding protein n=1 Tax=Longispora albida TaxID=203523 RepID=UPI0004755266|nr:ATP-binding protein [Longispora albida]